MSQIIALIPSFVSKDILQSLLQSQTWQELCLENAFATIQIKSCDIFSAQAIQNLIQSADQVLFIAIEALAPARLNQTEPDVLNSLATDSIARALTFSGVSRLLYVDLSGGNSDHDTVWKTIFDYYQLQFETYRPQIPFKNSFRQNSLDSNVCSVQVLPLIPTKTANWYIEAYYDYLSKKLWPLIQIQVQLDHQILIYFKGCPWPLLELTYDLPMSSAEHVVYGVSGGLLVQNQSRLSSRLELCLIKPLNQAVLALHDFVPALPWALYLGSQAWIHLWTVESFKAYLETFRLNRFNA